MRVIRKIGFFSLLVIATLFIKNAGAATLPISSYADDAGAWQGSSVFDEDGFYVRVDFAVYDTEYLLLPKESEFVEGLDMPGRYVYAYQIFNAVEEYTQEEVGYFAIFGIDEHVLDVYEDSIGSFDDGDGIEPSSAEFTESNRRGVWKFKDEEGFSVIGIAQYSYFLVFSSDSAPVAGDYEIRGPEEDFPVPPEIPEPATLILLGLGSALAMCTRRRKSV